MNYLLSFLFLICFSVNLYANNAAGCNIAEVSDCDQDLMVESGWQFGLGLATINNIPDYIGSDESRSLVLPVPYIRYNGPKFRLGQGGIVGKVFNSDNWFLSFSGSGAIPVDSDENRARQGMADLDLVFEYGPSIQYYFQGNQDTKNAMFIDLNIREARTISFESLGFNSSPAIVFRRRLQQPILGGEVNLGFRYRREFVSDDYADYFYGVAAQFATEQRAAYDAQGGNAGYRLSSNLRWQKGKNIVSFFMVYADINDAEYADSPLVKTKTHLYGGASYFWLF